MRRAQQCCTILLAMATIALSIGGSHAADAPAIDGSGWQRLSPYFTPPPQYAGPLGDFRSPLLFDDGTAVKTPSDWRRRRAEILGDWHKLMGPWPASIANPRIEYLESQHRETFTQHRVRIEIAPGQTAVCYLLVPDGNGPFPAIVVPFYDAETSAGLKNKPTHAFAYDLARRGFVTLSIGSPGGNAWKPEVKTGDKADPAAPLLQPLSYLAYVASNAYNALASLPEVDAKRIGIVGHSYGGKWALFASCLDDRYAAAVWSDPGIVWDEPRANVNYWEPWYLGRDPAVTRKAGLVTPDNPRTGAYKGLVEGKHDLVELEALMAPRPFLVSGGSEDSPARWVALNHAVAVNKLLGFEGRVGMTNRPAHTPTPESNESIYVFFDHFLAGK